MAGYLWLILGQPMLIWRMKANPLRKVYIWFLLFLQLMFYVMAVIGPFLFAHSTRTSMETGFELDKVQGPGPGPGARAGLSVRPAEGRGGGYCRCDFAGVRDLGH